MNSLIALGIRHGLAACAGFFAANNITGSSTTSIILGLLMILIASLWSWIAKLLHFEDTKGDVSGNQMLRTLLGALVSQGVTALSTYFAVDANNPELLGVAVVNAGLSKMGAHQKLAFLGAKDAVRLALLSLSVLSLASCSIFTKADAIDYGKRVAVSAGDAAVFLAEMELANKQNELDMALSSGANPREVIAKKLALTAAQEALKAAKKALAKERAKLDKQPLNVQPSTQAREPETNASPPCEEPDGACSTPRCVQIVVVPLRPLNLAGRGPSQATAHPETSARAPRPPAILIPDCGQRLAADLAQSH